MAREGYQIDGARLGKARTERDLTQQELADRCQLHRVTLTKIEGGARVSRETLERLATELGVTTSWLLGQDDVDELELARERLANAMSKIASGVEDFQAAVEVLQERAREASELDRSLSR